MWPLIAPATAAPPATARLPPSQKSFCTSTTISARVMPASSSVHRLQYRLAAGERPGLRRQGLAHPLVVRPGLGQGRHGAQLAARLPALHEGDDEVAVAVPRFDRRGADHLGHRDAVVVPPD